MACANEPKKAQEALWGEIPSPKSRAKPTQQLTAVDHLTSEFRNI
jgi:hypothetical protein